MPKNPRSNIYTYQIGNPIQMNRAYNFYNREDCGLGPAFFWNNYNKSIRCNASPNPPPPVYNTKIVALQDFSYLVDYRLVNTINYYLNNYPSLFTKFPIVDTGPTSDVTIQLLDEYYSKGYRYFILTAHSYIILDCISWFNEHPDTLGVTPYAQSSSLDVPKKIYNLTPLVYKKTQLYSNAAILPYDNIYFIYDSDQLINVSILTAIEDICNLEGKNLVTFPISSSVELTTPYINSIMSQITTGNSSSILVSMVTRTNIFYNLFDNTTPITGYNFYEAGFLPNFTNEESIIYFNGILYEQSFTQANLSTSKLWKDGLDYQGVVDYSPNALSALIVSQAMDNNTSILDLGSHCDSLIFNNITKISTNSSIVIYKFVVTSGIGNFIPYLIYYEDTNKNLYQAFVN